MQIAGAVLAVLSSLAACTSTWRDRGSLVEPGMSEAEVVELLGEPSSKVDVPAWGKRPAVARWQWNDNLSTLATGAMFPDTVPERVLAVVFDADGRVVEVVEPRSPAP
jgi:outer membrane protein assembly factor BamE (lipoprotein component of BamABCDE complex)